MVVEVVVVVEGILIISLPWRRWGKPSPGGQAACRRGGGRAASLCTSWARLEERGEGKKRY